MSGLGIRRGALSFKGTRPIKKVKVKEVLSDNENGPCIGVNKTYTGPEMKEGEGRVVCYGTILQGMETKFKEEIEVGDTIIVRHPQSLQLEERIVVGVISQRSLTLDSSFSSDFVSTTAYCIRKDSDLFKAKTVFGVKREEGLSHEGDYSGLSPDEVLQLQLKKRLDSEQKTLTYQEKTGMWGYRSVTEKVGKDMSKEELLDMRSKKVHDKYC